MNQIESNNNSFENNHLLISNDNEDNEIFNKQLFLSRTFNDKTLAKEILELFLKALPDNMNNIQKAIDLNDNSLLERSAHKLKGSLANISASRTQEIAYRLEKMGKESNFQETKSLFNDLETQMNILVSKIKEFIN